MQAPPVQRSPLTEVHLCSVSLATPEGFPDLAAKVCSHDDSYSGDEWLFSGLSHSSVTAQCFDTTTADVMLLWICLMSQHDISFACLHPKGNTLRCAPGEASFGKGEHSRRGGLPLASAAAAGGSPLLWVLPPQQGVPEGPAPQEAPHSQRGTCLPGLLVRYGSQCPSLIHLT